MAVFKCKMCGGTLEFEAGATVGVCDSCGTKQTLPRLDDDRRANLYDRANHFRRSNEFDKAMGIYETILNEDPTDAEAYWSLVLCRYGIEYVEDPATRRRVPTVNRAQYTSVLADEDYKAALKNADAAQKALYEAEAKAIDEIQKGILEISQKEEPFDVFICYKETDAQGRRTVDSVRATELYHELTREGFKVFFSRITLEDKLGTAYEPYIFAALNSAKVMVVLGTKPEHFNAVWVKNEWNRYLALIKAGAEKTLIPAYQDMDPYDLPEEFSHLQAQDMGKLGFMQDLIRGIKKITAADEPKPAVKETVVVSQPAAANVTALKKRGFLALEDGEWSKADGFFEDALNQNAEDAECYLGKLMAELQIRKRDDLKNAAQPFDGLSNCQKASRFDAAIAKELAAANAFIRERNETARKESIYQNGLRKMNAAKTEAEFKEATEMFGRIKGFKDADALAKDCLEKAEIARKEEIYNAAVYKKMSEYSIDANQYAIKLFESIIDWKDSRTKIDECKQKIEEIRIAEEKAEKERKRKAEESRIAAEKRKEKHKKIIAITAPAVAVLVVFLIVLNAVIIPGGHYKKAVAAEQSGDTVLAFLEYRKAGSYKDAAEKARGCQKSISGLIAAGGCHTVGLKADGTVVATGENGDGQCGVDGWKDIVAVAAGEDHTVGLKADGTVVATGSNSYGRCDVDGWKDIVAVAAGYGHTVGLKADGTVVATGSNYSGQCGVDGWKDIVAVAAGVRHTVGLKADGTVVATGSNGTGQCNVDGWTDIVAVAAGGSHTVGLKADGTVVATGSDYYGQCGVDGWTDIVAVYAGGSHTVGLKSDGTVVATGDNDNGQCGVDGWTDIVAVAAGEDHTVGLKANGRVVAVGYNDACDVGGWTGIVAVTAGQNHTVGLKADGTIVATGSNGTGRCDVDGWQNMKLPTTAN